MKNYKMHEDNAGGLHLAVLDDSGERVYYLCDTDRAFVMETLEALKAGGDPIRDGWEGGAADPQACYAEMSATVQERRGGACEVEM